jgi:trk system potassium uptake protein TrkH
MVLIHHISYTDAFFETMSGVTTTGSTVMSELAALPHSILLWRSMLQWVGGLGVIGMAVSILPFLQVGGMRLFQTESSDWSEKSLPRFHEMARALLLVYLAITLACALAYLAAGMTLFDAINHAMTTVSTGGYATDDSSMGRFSDTILWIAVLFMMIGGMPFMLYIRFLSQGNLNVLRDQQAQAFLLVVFGLISLLTLQQLLTSDREPLEVLTHAAFNIVSVITTTGYASSDYTQWGYFSIVFFFIVTFIGGCSGSTSGGMKIFRFQLSWLFLRDQMNKLVHPRGIFSIRYNGKAVSDDIMVSAVAFSFLFFLVLALTTLALAATGLDFVTALTGAATALTNVGPGLGDMIGPAGNFAGLPESGKWILGFAMILGRLELLTVMVLLTPVFWRG